MYTLFVVFGFRLHMHAYIHTYIYILFVVFGFRPYVLVLGCTNIHTYIHTYIYSLWCLFLWCLFSGSMYWFIHTLCGVQFQAACILGAGIQVPLTSRIAHSFFLIRKQGISLLQNQKERKKCSIYDYALYTNITSLLIYFFNQNYFLFLY